MSLQSQIAECRVVIFHLHVFRRRVLGWVVGDAVLAANENHSRGAMFGGMHTEVDDQRPKSFYVA
jgi:hypothetical protein